MVAVGLLDGAEGAVPPYFFQCRRQPDAQYRADTQAHTLTVPKSLPSNCASAHIFLTRFPYTRLGQENRVAAAIARTSCS